MKKYNLCKCAGEGIEVLAVFCQMLCIHFHSLEASIVVSKSRFSSFE